MKRLVLALGLVFCVVPALDGGRYLIIVPDSYYNSVLPLAAWKQASGMPCVVTRMSEIGSDTTALKNYIRNAWLMWPIPPEMVLLAGSQTMIPARQYTRQGSVYVSSDNIYGDMTGDLRAELPVGRLPAYSSSQLDAMVAKTLDYEMHPDLTDSLWMRRLTTIVREAGDQDDTVYWGNVRRAAQQAAALGFVGCDSLSYYRGDNADDVISSVNRGTGIVLYRGTATGTWYDPFVVWPSRVTTLHKLPIILSITCATMTLTPGEQMLGDSWIRTGTAASPRGAVAFFGNTHSASDVAAVRGAVCRGFYDGLFTEGVFKLGKVCMRAKQQLYQEFPNYTSDYRGFNLLGDPDLNVWTTTPWRPQVSHPSAIAPGAQTFVVTVTRSTVPVQSALVCVSMDSTVYAYGYTSALGTVSFSISPRDTGRLRLVVTGNNVYPYDVLVPVHSSGIEQADRPPAVPVAVAPTIAATNQPVRVTGPAGSTALVFGPDGSLVWSARSAAGSLVWNGAGDDAPGVYFCRVTDRQGQVLSQTRLVRLR